MNKYDKNINLCHMVKSKIKKKKKKKKIKKKASLNETMATRKHIASPRHKRGQADFWKIRKSSKKEKNTYKSNIKQQEVNGNSFLNFYFI